MGNKLYWSYIYFFFSPDVFYFLIFHAAFPDLASPSTSNPEPHNVSLLPLEWDSYWRLEVVDIPACRAQLGSVMTSPTSTLGFVPMCSVQILSLPLSLSAPPPVPQTCCQVTKATTEMSSSPVRGADGGKDAIREPQLKGYAGTAGTPHCMRERAMQRNG